MAAPVVQSVGTTSAIAADGGGNYTANLPSGITAGDLLVLWGTMWYQDSFSGVPTGWTAVAASTNHEPLNARAFWRIATGSEGSTVSMPYSCTGNDDARVIALRISGTNGSGIESFGVTPDYGPPYNCPTLTPAGTERLSIVACEYNLPSSTTATATNYTTQADLRPSGNLKSALATRQLPDASATGDINLTPGGTFPVDYIGLHMLVAPAAAGAPPPFGARRRGLPHLIGR